MKIEHIFNIINKKTEIYIDSQEFRGKFWENRRENYTPPDDIKGDFSKLYYNALVPSDRDKIISKYDEERLKNLSDKLGEDLLLISGDFWGIQKFIFDELTSSKASKILRSRSAMVQLITYAVSDRVKKEFEESESLLFCAGKFTILAKEEDNYLDKIKNIQKELDNYFLKNFFGQNGFILSTQKIKRDNLLNKNIEKELESLGRENELKKFNKFNLLDVEDDKICIDPFEEAKSDDEICEFCHKRVESCSIDKETKSCEICFNEINLGKKLTTFDYMNIIQFGKLSNKKKIGENLIKIIELGNKSYYARFTNFENHFTWGKTFDISNREYKNIDKWALNSYVAINENKKIKTFEELCENSSGLMALKADIDKLGDTFRDLYKKDFKKFNRLSREVEYFFSNYITRLIEEKRKNIYIIFSGGDDLFLIGEYKEIIELAKEIRDEFYQFSLGKTTISMGLVMFKPSMPINYISKMADDAERRAKKERDSIDIFGISMKFDEFIEIEEKFKEITDYLEKSDTDKSTFYYRLIELSDMRENIKKDIRNAMWKSKLNYIFTRNIKIENGSKILKKISDLIERGEKFKPSIFLKIYRNRDEKREQK